MSRNNRIPGIASYMKAGKPWFVSTIDPRVRILYGPSLDPSPRPPTVFGGGCVHPGVREILSRLEDDAIRENVTGMADTQGRIYLDKVEAAMLDGVVGLSGDPPQWVPGSGVPT